MLELGAKTAPAAPAAVKDATDQSFMADVVDASREAAIIVDFWAPWCGPCKTLTPALEAAVARTGGRARLVKIDVDANQMVASQLRVQSIPAVFAFVDGQPVDGFMGALPASEVEAFVKRVAAMGPGGDPIADALDQADAMLEEGAAADAVEVYAAVLGEAPDTLRATGGLARACIALGDMDRARALLDAVPPIKAHEAPIQAARSALDLAEQTAEVGETAELRARLDADPNDHQARFDLALALIAARDNAGALDELLELFRRDREWSDGAAKTQLVKFFDSLGPKDPLVARGRRRLASMMFA
ncbi:thioredoxin family protein [Rubrimonas cliftonensis]|uniref:Thioredoxin n=1 Tax=Rubrimonas cliftonensis TaxID=89524 RepID=A0A1H4FN11_9RHOB|nr:co-chaperone YbbN [Rubrimonas cliftonensis]SEA98696.1 thioredoxin [Rubrimonas cliftonensis]